MRNPLESEEAAFRFVLGTIVYFAPIVVGSRGSRPGSGSSSSSLMTVVAVVVLRGDDARADERRRRERAAVEDTRRILVVTNATLGGARSGRRSWRSPSVTEDVLVVCPRSTRLVRRRRESRTATPARSTAAICSTTERSSELLGRPAIEDALRRRCRQVDPLHASRGALRWLRADADRDLAARRSRVASATSSRSARLVRRPARPAAGSTRRLSSTRRRRSACRASYLPATLET